MKPTKKQVMSLLEEFYQVCKNDPDKTVHYFAGFMMSAFSEIAEHPEKIESEIKIIKEQIQKIKNEKTN